MLMMTMIIMILLLIFLIIISKYCNTDDSDIGPYCSPSPDNDDNCYHEGGHFDKDDDDDDREGD